MDNTCRDCKHSTANFDLLDDPETAWLFQRVIHPGWVLSCLRWQPHPLVREDARNPCFEAPGT